MKIRLLISLLVFSCTVQAAYPEKPIRLIVPWPAGGGSDVVARRVVEPLS